MIHSNDEQIADASGYCGRLLQVPPAERPCLDQSISAPAFQSSLEAHRFFYPFTTGATVDDINPALP